MTDTDNLRLLGKKYAITILLAANEPKTAKELSEEYDIPIATCHRRIDELHEHNLLEVTDARLTGQHHRAQQYQRAIDGVSVTFDDVLSVRTLGSQ